jgi:hypothetical protein
VLFDAGESIKALSGYLGYHDPGSTFRTYTHLMQKIQVGKTLKCAADGTDPKSPGLPRRRGQQWTP